MMSTLHQEGGKYLSYTKGSPDEVLERCSYIRINGKDLPMSRVHREKIQKTLKEFTGDALRVLALGMRTGVSGLKEEELIFIGMAGMADPVRPEAGKAVEEFRHAGVRTIMITGDRSDTAFAIAKSLALQKNRSNA